MAHAKHPLIATHGAHAFANLISKRLECETMIRCGERAAQAVAWSVRLLRRRKQFDGFLESTVKQVFISAKRNASTGFQFRACRQMETMNGVEKKKGSNALVKILAL